MKNIVSNLFYILLGAIIIMTPTFYNGFPLVFADTGTYISSGMQLFVPGDRPILYGLFIRLFNFSFSLWLVIFVQCLILSYVLFLSFLWLVESNRAKPIFILSVIFLTSLTAIGWCAGQLMPDIFTPISILAIGLLLFHQKLNRLNKILISIILVFSAGVHFSTIFIDVLLVIFCFILIKLNGLKSKKIKNRYLLLPLYLILTSVIFIGTINYTVEKKYSVSQNGNLFVIGRLIDSGVLKSFLDDKCPTNDYLLCDCKDNLPVNSRQFLWDENSLKKYGDWNHTFIEYNTIIVDILKSPKHCLMFIGNSASSSFTQLFQNQIGSELITTWYAMPGSPPYEAIAKHFPNQLNPYNDSRQNTNLWGQTLNLDLINMVNYFLLIGSVTFLIFIIHVKSIWENIAQKTKYMIIICVTGILLNAVVTATLANVYDRLQARVSWMMVLVPLLVMATDGRVLVTYFSVKIKSHFNNT